MKKVIAILLAMILVLALSACGGGTAEEPAAAPESGEPLDLTGTWVQENPKTDVYMTASIREDGKIGVFFVVEGEESEPWTYWVGTYDAPAESTSEYTWVSANTYAGYGVLSSADETKEFTYKNGKIVYTVTIDGDSGEVTLVRGDWDVSSVPETEFIVEKINMANFKNLEIADSGWCLKNGEWVYYYVTLHNPNEDIVVELPTFRITARDADGILLGTEDQTISVVYPGQDFVFGSQAFSVEEMPATVEFEVLEPADYNLSHISAKEEFKPLTVENGALKSEKLLGEISNPNGYDIDTAVLVVLCRNAAGELVGVENTYVDNVKAGGLTPFSTSLYLNVPVDTVEFYANSWD